MTFTIYFDAKKCSGCFACAVACMDQNDINVEEKGTNTLRRVFKFEDGVYPEASIRYISLSCMHCTDAPCVMACPIGAIRKDMVSGTIQVRKEICIGCHSCSIACPFGVPRFGQDGKMQKCDMCIERLKYGLEPACVRICPSKALTIGPINELSDLNEAKSARKLIFQGCQD